MVAKYRSRRSRMYLVVSAVPRTAKINREERNLDRLLALGSYTTAHLVPNVLASSLRSTVQSHAS